MPDRLEFDRRFSDFGEDVLPLERAPEVLDVVEEFMRQWGYSVRNLIGAGLSVENLGDGTPSSPDLIFRIRGFDYFEIVIRAPSGKAWYGGWLTGTLPIVVSDEQVNGRPVLLTTTRNGAMLRHTCDPILGYRPAGDTATLPLDAARRLARPNWDPTPSRNLDGT